MLIQCFSSLLARQWTSQHEKKFLVTLSALKGRDPKIYNKDEVIFGEVDVKDDEERSRRTAEESKPGNKMTLKDYEREIMSKEGLYTLFSGLRSRLSSSLSI